MPIKNGDYGVTLVIFGATWRQLCAMADVQTRRETIVNPQAWAGNPPVGTETHKNVQTILPVGFTAEATFWVCAAMLLGNADAMMLAAISRKQGDGTIWFDGLEVA